MRLRPLPLAASAAAASLALLGVTASSARPGMAPRAATATAAAPRPDVVLTIHGHRDPKFASVSSKAMYYLPFDVPAGVTRITIHHAYDHGPDPTVKNTVDFGLFDPRGGGKKPGERPSAAGVRGWEGGSPADFVITGDPATCSPHAIPGPIPAGRWNIAQYFLTSTPAGLTYTYTITLSFDGPAPPTAAVAPAAYDPGVVKGGPGWYAGNLHCHSLHSDGGRTFEETIARCEANGFDFVASTEHNSTTAHYDFPAVGRDHPNVLLLYGDEFTSPGGHAGIIGQRPGYWFDFRIDPGDGQLPGIIADAHQQGALFVINHPFAMCTSCPWRYTPAEWVDQADGIEVWNGTWTPDDRLAIDLWDTLLRQGKHLNAYGGTDYHRGDDVLTPAALTYAASLSTPAVLDGLRKGHVVLSESPRGPHVVLTTPADADKAAPSVLPGDTLKVPAGDTPVALAAHVTGAAPGMRLRVVWSTGEATYPVRSEAGDTVIPLSVPFPANAARSYVRAELLKGDEPVRTAIMVSLTNPIYLSR